MSIVFKIINFTQKHMNEDEEEEESEWKYHRFT